MITTLNSIIPTKTLLLLLLGSYVTHAEPNQVQPPPPLPAEVTEPMRIIPDDLKLILTKALHAQNITIDKAIYTTGRKCDYLALSVSASYPRRSEQQLHAGWYGFVIVRKAYGNGVKNVEVFYCTGIPYEAFIRAEEDKITTELLGDRIYPDQPK